MDADFGFAVSLTACFSNRLHIQTSQIGKSFEVEVTGRVMTIKLGSPCKTTGGDNVIFRNELFDTFFC